MSFMKRLKYAVGIVGVCTAFLFSACNSDESKKDNEPQQQMKLRWCFKKYAETKQVEF